MWFYKQVFLFGNENIDIHDLFHIQYLVLKPASNNETITNKEMELFLIFIWHQ